MPISVMKVSSTSCDAASTYGNWRTPYREFEKLALRILDDPNLIVIPGVEARINEAVFDLYAQHTGDPDWDEAYRRWHGGY